MARKKPPPPAASKPPTAARPSSLVDTRVVNCGDNLEQLRKLPPECVDLIYIDPPFNSNRQDEFCAWFGLDSPLVYAAHKAAGGMTSVYRQIGLSCQLVFQNVLQDTLGLSAAGATWSHKVKAKGAKAGTLARGVDRAGTDTAVPPCDHDIRYTVGVREERGV